MTYAHWVTAILRNGLGGYADAFTAARQARQDHHIFVSTWTLPELIEAAVRTSNTQVAADALEWLAETTQPCGTDWALGVEARCRAMLADGPARRRPVPRGDRPAKPDPAPARIWPAPTCSTANGCAGRTAGWTPGRSCGPHRRC